MQLKQPISYKILTYILLSIIVILSLVAGLYQSAYKLEQKKYNKLEDMYVRVRDVLGREETQRLIDLSYEQEAEQNTDSQEDYDF